MSQHRMVAIIAVVACVALSGRLMSNANSATGSEGLTRVAAGHIESAQRDLSGLKPDVFKGIMTLQQYTLDAQEESEKWVRLGNLESDVQMKSVNFAFRDGFRLHAQTLAQIQQLLVDLGHIGERLETNLKLLSALQTDLEGMSGGQGQGHAQASSTKELLGLLQKDLQLSATMFTNLRDRVSEEVFAILEYNRKVRDLHTSLGNPQDRIKKWGKQVVETALELNAKEGKQLSNVSKLAARMTQILLTLGEATKAQQLVVIGFQ